MRQESRVGVINLLVDIVIVYPYGVLNQLVEKGEAVVAKDSLSQAFAALSDPNRRAMVMRLCEGDAALVELAEPLDMSMQAVSKHLRVLEDAGLVTRTQDAQRRPAHLEAEVFDLMTKWIDRYRRRAEERYRRLDAVLATMPDPPTPKTTGDQS
jgi:DNA-binding transcriptional ArsR family regulator